VRSGGGKMVNRRAARVHRTSNYTTATDTRTENMSWTHRKIKQASERARQRVNIRWNRVRAEQAKMDAAPMPDRRIVERHVVIRDECRVREAVFYADDRPCDVRRKLRTLKGVW
jgi:hypothetical protein